MICTPRATGRSLVLLLIAASVTACGSRSAVQPPPPTQNGAVTALGIKYVAVPPSFAFRSEDTVNGWIQSLDTAAISKHRWELWAALTTDSGQAVSGTRLPVWETWYSGTEVYLDNPSSKNSASADGTRVFQVPGQFEHSRTLARQVGTPAAGDTAVLSFNRFTQEMKDHVQAPDDRYYDAASLTTLNDTFAAGTPLAERKVVDFPSSSVMLKPVFVLASGTEPTVLPYWNGTGEEATTAPLLPIPQSWKQCVLLDPTGQATNEQDRLCNHPVPQAPKLPGGATYGDTPMKAGTYDVLPLSADSTRSAVYAFELTQDEVDGIKHYQMLFNPNGDDLLDGLKAGDYAVLVATHVSTREIANWTWQTFWWEPNLDRLPSEPPDAEPPPRSIPAPWSSYASCTAYYMTERNAPGAKPLACFNPYLETNLEKLENVSRTDKTLTGVGSNCMTCHRAAAYAPEDADASPGGYAHSGLLRADDPLWFTNNVKADFLWSIPVRAHDPPFAGP